MEVGFVVVVEAFCVGETACVEAGSFVVVFTKLVRRRVGALFVRRRQSAGVGVGAFGCKLRELLGLPRRHVPTDRRRASGPATREVLHFLFFSFYLGIVCVCCEALSVK